MNAQVAQAPDNVMMFPVGRIVSGDLYTPQEKDANGNPMVIKTGPNIGKPRINYFFALAVPKTPGATHWAYEKGWGEKIWAYGHKAWPRGQSQRPDFAWKIEDGDSTIPNKKDRRNCDREGYPGHWILKFGSSFPTKVYDENGNAMPQPGIVKPGFYVEVWGSFESNESEQTPGIYLNHNMVAYRAPGKVIAGGADPHAVGFGKQALPAGVTAAPAPGNTATLPGTPPPPAEATASPPAGNSPPPPPVATPASTAPQPTAVAPNPSFIAPPAAGVQPAPTAPAAAAPPPPAAAPTMPAPDALGAPAGFRMANPAGARYEAFRSQGWTDEQLLTAGHMVRL